MNLQSWEIRQVLHSFIFAIFFIYYNILIISETTYIFRQIKRRKKRSQISMGSTSQRYKSNFNLLHHYSHCNITVSCILQKKSIESITRQKYGHPEKKLALFWSHTNLRRLSFAKLLIPSLLAASKPAIKSKLVGSQLKRAIGQTVLQADPN